MASVPPSPIPAPLPPWARALLQLEPLIQTGLQEVLQYIGIMKDAAQPTPDTWMHIQLVGKPLASVNRSDEFVTTFDIVNITNGHIDNTWTSTDTQKVSIALANLMLAWASTMSSQYTWTEQRFYLRQFNPYTLEKPYAKSGPPAIIYPYVVAGGLPGPMAPQVSLTSTDRTAYAKHWGRNYWPHPTGAMVASTGETVTHSAVDGLADAVHVCYAALMADEFYPVVTVTQVDKAPVRGLLTVSSIQVDDLFDVIRRRRPKQASYKRVRSLT